MSAANRFVLVEQTKEIYINWFQTLGKQEKGFLKIPLFFDTKPPIFKKSCFLKITMFCSGFDIHNETLVE